MGSSGGARYHWIDFAKALAITLVVIYHVGAAMDFLFPPPPGAGEPFWSAFNRIAVPLRMPLFFVTAGLLAHSALARRWKAVMRPRVVALVWPYVLWSIALACVAAFAYRPSNITGYLVERLSGLPLALSGYWFLLVLAIFFIVAKLLRRWAFAILAAALVLAMASPWLELHAFPGMPWLTIYGVTRVARYLFWFLLGCYASRFVSRIANANPITLSVGGGVGFVVLTWYANSTDSGALLGFALSVTGVTAMVGVSISVARIEKLRRAFRYLAVRTLPIYLIHPILIVLLIIGVRVMGGIAAFDDIATIVLIPAIAAMCILVSVLLFNEFSTGRAAWVFALPAWPSRIGRRRPRTA